jgi:hypothetical protein
MLESAPNLVGKLVIGKLGATPQQGCGVNTILYCIR